MFQSVEKQHSHIGDNIANDRGGKSIWRGGHFTSKRPRLAEAASSNAGGPNLSVTMYPFNIPRGEHVPLQHFNT